MHTTTDSNEIQSEISCFTSIHCTHN